MIRHGSGRLRATQQQQQKFKASPTNQLQSRRCIRFPLARCCMRDLNSHCAVLGLTPFASKSDVKLAYKRLALKYHPDVYKGGDLAGQDKIFMDVKLAYESLMQTFEDEESPMAKDYDEYDELDEWMGFEGGIPVVYNSF